MKVVLDTNIYVSATFSKGKPYRILKLAEKSKITLVTSPEIVDELRDVLTRDKIPFSEDEVDSFVGKVLSFSIVVSPEADLDVVDDDDDDDKIIECAVGSGSDYIVSGDSHLLDIGEYEGIEIVDAETFLEEVV